MPRGILLALLLAPAAAAPAAATAQAQAPAAVATGRPGAVPEVAAAGGRATVAARPDWALDPAIRDFVGPAEYAWDFNAPDSGTPGSTPAPAAGGQGEGSAMRIARALPDRGPAARR